MTEMELQQLNPEVNIRSFKKIKELRYYYHLPAILTILPVQLQLAKFRPVNRFFYS